MQKDFTEYNQNGFKTEVSKSLKTEMGCLVMTSHFLDKIQYRLK